MLVEATLDFPEEEIDFLEKYQARAALEAIRNDLQHLTQQARQGIILREGLHVVLAGQPNVGQPSLLNALAGDDIALVTPDRKSVVWGTRVAVRVDFGGSRSIQ